MWLRYAQDNMSTYFRRRGLVFVDGKPLGPVETPAELAGPSPRSMNYFTEVHWKPLSKEFAPETGKVWIETNGMALHIRLANNDDPARRVVEITTLEQIFSPAERYQSYIRVKGITLALGIVVELFVTVGCNAENPIIQTNFTADPAPLVYNGTVYLYTSHDEDDATEFEMLNWKLYTSTDMVNWTDHGTVASLATFPWAVQSNDAWAPQAIERNGKFYLYVPISVPGSPKNVNAVAVADSPFGPFEDALGHPLIDKADGNIDPTVFIDDDGQAYLYWGNPDLWYVKLNQDMISYSGHIVKVDSKAENYQEGPWFYKRKCKYYGTTYGYEKGGGLVTKLRWDDKAQLLNQEGARFGVGRTRLW